MNELEGCNWALCKIGQRPLESLEEDSFKALYCRLLYPAVHRSLLRSFSWSFATYEGVLAPRVSEGGGVFRYPLPRYCLKIVKAGSGCRIMGGEIIREGNSSASVSIQYLKEVPLSHCDPLYQEAFAFKLASELCPLLVADAQLGGFLKGESDKVLALAIELDGIEILEDREY